MKPTDDPLAALRDYHLPEAVGWWPPAPGWWLLTLLVLLAVLWLSLLLRRRWRRNAATRAARRELEQLRRRLTEDGDSGRFLRELALLLRRFALTRFPRAEVAGLTGRAWLEFLERHSRDGGFLQGVGQVLLTGPYQAAPEYDASALALLAEGWIRHNREGAA